MAAVQENFIKKVNQELKGYKYITPTNITPDNKYTIGLLGGSATFNTNPSLFRDPESLVERYEQPKKRKKSKNKEKIKREIVSSSRSCCKNKSVGGASSKSKKKSTKNNRKKTNKSKKNKNVKEQLNEEYLF